MFGTCYLKNRTCPSKTVPSDAFCEDYTFRRVCDRKRGNRPRRSLATAAFFRVPAVFHREFKLYAVQNGLTMVDLLQESFRAFQQ